MPRVIEPPAGDAIDLAEAAARIDERGVDLTDPDSLDHAAGVLMRLSRNRTFLGDLVLHEMKQRFAGQDASNAYSAQVVMLHRARHRHFIRANLWPAANDAACRASGPEHFAYGLPHDHNFDFLTVGYRGPGYVSDYYEIDAADVLGVPGETVPMRFVERSTLDEGKLMLYRAHRDIHCQFPPDRLSVSLNIMGETAEHPWRDQFILDLERGTVLRCDTLSAMETLLRAAVHVAGDEGRDVADHVARHHPLPRARAEAWIALAGAEPDAGAAIAVLEQAIGDRDRRVAHTCAVRIEALAGQS